MPFVQKIKDFERANRRQGSRGSIQEYVQSYPEEIRATAATLPLPTNCYMPRAKGLPAIRALLFLPYRSTTSTVGCILFGSSTAYTMGHTSNKHRRCPFNIFSSLLQCPIPILLPVVVWWGACHLRFLWAVLHLGPVRYAGLMAGWYCSCWKVRVAAGQAHPAEAASCWVR